MWPFAKHVRLAGGLICIATVFLDDPKLRILGAVIGLMVQYLGVLIAIDRLEKLVDLIVADKEK